jgi:glycosyltransferase involved in cell wall biosynthesis
MAKYRPVMVLPNALDGSRYPALAYTGTALKPKLVWLRSFHHIYNPHMAIEVLSLLRGDFPDAELTMIGPDDGDGSFESTRQLANKLGVTGAVHFSGAIPKSDVPAWLTRSTVFLNTTNIDNSPVSVLEAMACGLLVVSTNVGGVPDLIEDEQNGLLVPAGDSRAMAARVRNLLERADWAHQLSFNARHTAAGHDWGQVLPQWEELFHLVAMSPQQ